MAKGENAYNLKCLIKEEANNPKDSKNTLLSAA